MNDYGSVIGQGNVAMSNDYGAKEATVLAMRSVTVGENIARQIARHQSEIERLSALKAQLEGGASLLTIRIEDLRQAMNY